MKARARKSPPRTPSPTPVIIPPHTPSNTPPNTLVHAIGLVVDCVTGDILGYDSKPSVYSLPTGYTVPVSRAGRADESGWLFDPEWDRKVEGFAEPDAESEEEEGSPPPSEKEGRPPRVFYNDWAVYIALAVDRKLSWLDDFIYGACYVCAGDSKGRLNVSPKNVRNVCQLSIVSTVTVRTVAKTRKLTRVSTRQAQRMVKAAIFAVRGIELYLERHPGELEKLMPEVADHTYDVAYAEAYREAMAAVDAESDIFGDSYLPGRTGAVEAPLAQVRRPVSYRRKSLYRRKYSRSFPLAA